jgi:urease alpha subunit
MLGNDSVVKETPFAHRGAGSMSGSGNLVIRDANILTMNPRQPRARALYTINAARIGFEEQDKGSLEAGKLGDMVVLSGDPFGVEPGNIKDIPVDMTIVGGQIAYERS